MTIAFTCPHCGTQTDVFDEFAGHSGPCAVCGKLITVPYPATVPMSTVAGAVPKAAPARAQPARTGPSLASIIAVVFGGVLAATALTVFLIVFVFPMVSSARVTAQKRTSAKNLQAIALALQRYADEHGVFPPAFIADKDGNALHSWRVLILPQLGYEPLYRRYDLSQPWNSPQNLSLASSMPEEYVCPADPDARAKHETSYMVVVGKGTMFPGEKSIRRSDIKDPLSDTIMLVETRTNGVSWLQPVDLDLDRMQLQVNGRAGAEISSHHPGGANVCTADGTPHFLSDSGPPDELKSLLLIDDGGSISWSLVE